MHELVAKARAMDAEAREHKRLANQHRLAAQACRKRQAELEEACDALGIKVIYTDGEGTIHGQGTPRPGSLDAH